MKAKPCSTGYRFKISDGISPALKGQDSVLCMMACSTQPTCMNEHVCTDVDRQSFMQYEECDTEKLTRTTLLVD
jgi:hypothetical protein